MPEDQGVNGDIWTEQAGKLLQRLGWTKVADSNIDVPGSDGLTHGIDSMFKYPDEYRGSTQGIVLEAKSYLTSSFATTKITDWLDKLNKKLLQVRRSEEFYRMYPPMSDAVLQNGVLFLWFRDHARFDDIRPKLNDAMLSARIPRSKLRDVNRLFVITNDRILRLSSIIEVVDRHKQTTHPHPVRSDLEFVYTAPVGARSFTSSTRALSLEYMMSNVVLARAQALQDNGYAHVSFVFYFGPLTWQGFERLKEALLRVNFPQERLYLTPKTRPHAKVESINQESMWR